ncbi:hypothetical protein [Paenibacillus sp. YPG26]|uniref:hypothetical protein n=1 Tax=Paenibacillus sp. YPG26 TaxID=2878915 RepID=UPI002040512C|nr:hypothetical protein [Paenibacillus sp. YPG26]USB33994.1 hypothetical protein LDO05_04000 [Paenibacillus sp. YPG26]
MGDPHTRMGCFRIELIHPVISFGLTGHLLSQLKKRECPTAAWLMGHSLLVFNPMSMTHGAFPPCAAIGFVV